MWICLHETGPVFKCAVTGEKTSDGPIENTLMLLRGIIRTITCHTESNMQEELCEGSPILPLLVEHSGCILSARS